MSASNSKGRASLRNADWRFLLPAHPDKIFEHLVLPEGSPDLARLIIEEGIARRVSCNIPQGRDADAVIITSYARVALGEAISCLKPGGALYYEVQRRSFKSLALTPHRVRKSLRGLGLSPTATYWVRPDFANYKIYLPLDARWAIDWYLNTHFIAATPASRLLEPFLRILARFGSRPLAPFATSYAVTAIAGTNLDAAPPALGQLELPVRLSLSNSSISMITSAGDERSRVILLPFAPDAKEPAMVLKVSRRSDFNAHTEREQTVLATLRSILDESMKRSIPEPIVKFYRSRFVIGVESYKPGRSLSSTSGRWQGSTKRKTSDLLLASRWLSNFHRQAQVSLEPWGPDQIACIVEKPLATYSQTFGPAPNERRLFDEVRNRAAAMTGKPFPIVWQHHDFGEWNIYRVRDQIRVIDWERAKTGPALCDLLWLVVHWNIIAQNIRDDDGQLGSFRELFLDPAPHKASVKVARQAIWEYMRRLEIDGRFFPIFLVLTWAEHALDHLERQQATGEAKEDPRQANRYISYLTTLAQNTEQLFDAPIAGIV